MLLSSTSALLALWAATAARAAQLTKVDYPNNATSKVDMYIYVPLDKGSCLPWTQETKPRKASCMGETGHMLDVHCQGPRHCL